MSNYPPYACKCCGFANGDMFYDWLEGREATEKEILEFDIYRKVWGQLQEERSKAKEISLYNKYPVGRKHSDAVRAKISETKRKSNKVKVKAVKT